LRFGMTSTEVRTAMNALPSAFRKTDESAFPTEAFRAEGVHVFYRAPGVCEAIEFGAGASVTLHDLPLLDRSFGALLSHVRSLDSSVEIDESGLTSKALGIALYAPGHLENPDEPVSGVFVFEDGYY